MDFKHWCKSPYSLGAEMHCPPYSEFPPPPLYKQETHLIDHLMNQTDDNTIC